MDLPYIYNVNGSLEIIENDKNKSVATLVAAGTKFLLDGNRRAVGDIFKKEIMNLVTGGTSDAGAETARRQKNIEANETNADVIMFSGCKDDQTSADTQMQGEAIGAMSYALVHTLKKKNKKRLTYTALLQQMRHVLEGKYTQVPQMSAGRKLILDQPFQI